MIPCLNFLSTESFSIFVILGHNGGLSPLYLLLIAGLGLTTQKRPLLARGIQPWLGEISYGIYILHLPVSSHTYRISAWMSQYIPIDPFWFRAAILITASAILYKFVEVPAREFLRGKKTPSRVVDNPEIATISS
jgi:peptidoglycan/LPS O-acetylase OafA/YrhL